MKRTGRGIPAAAVLANGLSRHGAHCHCRICVDIRAADAAFERNEREEAVRRQWLASNGVAS